MTRRTRILVPALLSLLLALTVTAAANQDQGTGSPGDPNRPEIQLAAPVDGENQMVPAWSWLSVPAAAFKPGRSNVDWRPSAEGGCLYAGDGDPETWWHAPVYLPQGVTIRRLWLSAVDSNPDYGAETNLTVYNSNGSVQYRWESKTEGSQGGLQWVFAEPEHVVNNRFYTYELNWRPMVLGDSLQICGFYILYQ